MYRTNDVVFYVFSVTAEFWHEIMPTCCRHFQPANYKENKYLEFLPCFLDAFLSRPEKYDKILQIIDFILQIVEQVLKITL